ncbi:MAG: hypothetical protein RSG59_08485 [Ruthenibacterium sp.]
MDEKELEERASALAEKEAQLAQKQQQLEEKEKNIIYKGAKEHFYDKLNIPLWLLDAIIAACFAGILLAIILGLINK